MDRPRRAAGRRAERPITTARAIPYGLFFLRLIRLSVPAASRWRFSRCFHTTSAANSATNSVSQMGWPAVRLHMEEDTANAIIPTIEPSDTYRVISTRLMKTTTPTRKASGLTTSAMPAQVSTPLPPRKPK